MSTTVTYRCDACQATVQTAGPRPQQFWHVVVGLNSFGNDYGPHACIPMSADLCRACVDRLGLMGKESFDNRPEPKPTTMVERMEELLREFAREEVRT